MADIRLSIRTLILHLLDEQAMILSNMGTKLKYMWMRLSHSVICCEICPKWCENWPGNQRQGWYTNINTSDKNSMLWWCGFSISRVDTVPKYSWACRKDTVMIMAVRLENIWDTALINGSYASYHAGGHSGAKAKLEYLPTLMSNNLAGQNWDIFEENLIICWY